LKYKLGVLNYNVSVTKLKKYFVENPSLQCIIPQAVKHRLGLLRMGKNFPKRVELIVVSINCYCCIWLVFYIIYINEALKSEFSGLYCLWTRTSDWWIFLLANIQCDKILRRFSYNASEER